MNQPSERPLSLACVAPESSVSARLQEALLTLFPGATVQLVDVGVERGLPDAIDCAVVDAGGNAMEGTDVLRTLRAQGYSGAAVLLVDPLRPRSEPAAADRLGARYCSLDGDSIAPLATAITDSIRSQVNPDHESAISSAISLRALRQTQRLLAAGDLATRLQHSLNNPLAALLAEAQLLELEPLLPDHRASVERIIELSRRVIDVVRALDGVGRA
jgi:signal transduction histidine kinase